MITKALSTPIINIGNNYSFLDVFLKYNKKVINVIDVSCISDLLYNLHEGVLILFIQCNLFDREQFEEVFKECTESLDFEIDNFFQKTESLDKESREYFFERTMIAYRIFVFASMKMKEINK